MKQRLRFLIALLIPFGYLYFADIFVNLGSIWPFLKALIVDARFWFFLFLLILVVFFILLPDREVKGWFKFCGMQEAKFEEDFRNRWEKVCYGLVYGPLGIFIIVSCLYKVAWLPLSWIPQELANPQLLGRRIMWCIGWSLAGLSIRAISDARLKKEDVKSPFPSYVYFYPPFLIVNSLVIFGFLNSKGIEFFYPVAAFLSLNLAFWIDSVNFNRLVNGLLNSMEKLFNK